MFFPSKEFPTPLLENALASLGVTCRQLPDTGLEAFEQDGSHNYAEGNGLSGFTLKIAALILSQFEEVGTYTHLKAWAFRHTQKISISISKVSFGVHFLAMLNG